MSDRVYKFAEFELIPSKCELRTRGSITRLQEKPLILLSVLLDHPQSLVTREELRRRMWGPDTFVDYEQGINVAIKKVRDALGDSAKDPRFIETVVRKGYRFLIPADLRCLDRFDMAAAKKPVISRFFVNRLTRTTQAVRQRWVVVAAAAGVSAALGVLILRERTRPELEP